MVPVKDASIQLRDGRRLAYAEWGDTQGAGAFFFHGTPQSRLWCPDEEKTLATGVHLVTVDRPGVGGSDVLPRRTLADWPSDVVQLADFLGWERFAVIGWSAGGPYAAACGALIPERLSTVGIGACRHLSQFNLSENPSAAEQLDEDDRRCYELADRDVDELARTVIEEDGDWVRTLAARPESVFEGYERPSGDLWLIEDEERLSAFLDGVRESVRQGPAGFVWELIDLYQPWGFRVADIATKTYVWHGNQDTIVARTHVDFLVGLLPDAELTVWPDSGHDGVARHWEEVLAPVAPR